MSATPTPDHVTNVTPATILTATPPMCFDGGMTNTHHTNTDCGSLYVGDTVYFQDSDTCEQVERLQWVSSAERQDLLIVTTDLSVRTMRFGDPVERIARMGRRVA